MLTARYFLLTSILSPNPLKILIKLSPFSHHLKTRVDYEYIKLYMYMPQVHLCEALNTEDLFGADELLGHDDAASLQVAVKMLQPNASEQSRYVILYSRMGFVFTQKSNYNTTIPDV